MKIFLNILMITIQNRCLNCNGFFQDPVFGAQTIVCLNILPTVLIFLLADGVVIKVHMVAGEPI